MHMIQAITGQLQSACAAADTLSFVPQQRSTAAHRQHAPAARRVPPHAAAAVVPRAAAPLVLARPPPGRLRPHAAIALPPPSSAHVAVGAAPLAGRLHIRHGARHKLVVALQMGRRWEGASSCQVSRRANVRQEFSTARYVHPLKPSPSACSNCERVGSFALQHQQDPPSQFSNQDGGTPAGNRRSPTHHLGLRPSAPSGLLPEAPPPPACFVGGPLVIWVGGAAGSWVAECWLAGRLGMGGLHTISWPLLQCQLHRWPLTPVQQTAHTASPIAKQRHHASSLAPHLKPRLPSHTTSLPRLTAPSRVPAS